MNDMGVSLHAHNRQETFFDALRTLRSVVGVPKVNPWYLTPQGSVYPGRDDSPVLGINRTTPIIHNRTLKQILDRNVVFQGSVDEYTELAVRRLINHLRQHWDASRPTLFAHSSGWDSRILSHCLVTLRDNGFNLGDIHFRCREPEQESFLRVMQHQGWRPDQYSVFPMPEKDPLDVGIWERPGVSPWMPVTSQINFWRDIVPYAEEQNWNLIGGSGGGEACEYPALAKKPTVPWQFCNNYPVQLWWSYFPDGTDWAADVERRFAKVLFPYFSAEHILTVSQQNPNHIGLTGPFTIGSCDNIRTAMMRQFPNHTLDIPRQPRTYSWSISEDRWADMRNKYAASHFLREVPGAPAADDLIRQMQTNFFTGYSWAERVWRLASIWDAVAETK